MSALGPPKASAADLPLLGAWSGPVDDETAAAVAALIRPSERGAAGARGAGAAEEGDAGGIGGGAGGGGAAWKFSPRRFLKFVGPGLLMSIAYVDPGNLESDLQVGAKAGYRLLWVLLWSTMLGYILQMQAAKLGVVTRRNLAQHCRARFARGPRLLLWLMAEVAIIGSDIQEVIGSAIAILLLTRGAVPLWGGILLSAAASFTLLLIERFGVRLLEAVFAALIATMVGSFLRMYVAAAVPAGEVVRGFLLPVVPRENVGQAVALLGSLLMPHNLYLHSALVQTRRLRAPGEGHRREALAYFGLESALSLAVSVLINMCVVCVFAAGFHTSAAPPPFAGGVTGAGVTSSVTDGVAGSDPDLGLQNAGEYLGRTYGSAIVLIWALGLLAAGQSSTMTGCYTGQFVMEGFLDWKVAAWVRVLATRLVALVPTLAVARLSGSAGRGGGSTSLDKLNQVLNLLQSVQLPFALLPVLTLNADARLMGPFANGPAATAALGAMSAAVVGVNLAGVWAFSKEHLAGAPRWAWAAAGAGVLAYFGALGSVVFAAARGNGGVDSGGRDGGGGNSSGERDGGGLRAPLLDSNGAPAAAAGAVPISVAEVHV